MPNRILTMLDFDDCLLPNTIDYYRPVLREMTLEALRKLQPGFTEEEYLIGEAISLARYGSYFKHWENTVAGEDPEWTIKLYEPMVPYQIAAIKAAMKPDPAVAKAVGTLKERGHSVYIVTHSYFEYCHPLAEFAGFADHIPPENIIDLKRAGNRTKSTGEPYKLVRSLAGEGFSITNMADDVAANLKPVKELGIIGHLVSHEAPTPEQAAHIHFHHKTILDALAHLANQTA